MEQRPQIGTTVSLHVVQEMLEFCGSESLESDDSEVDLMVLYAVTQSAAANSSAIHLSCEIAGQDAEFLLDSGSSHYLSVIVLLPTFLAYVHYLVSNKCALLGEVTYSAV
jgi:hypothetical protein